MDADLLLMNIKNDGVKQEDTRMDADGRESMISAYIGNSASQIGNIAGIDNSTKNSESDSQSVGKLKDEEKPVGEDEDSKWHTVGIFTGQSATVSGYVDNNSWSSAGLPLKSDNLPDLSKYSRVSLEPGVAYRFRLRAINQCGASEWSDVSSFKTCLPGFPGAPSAIKISKSYGGAHLTWEPPPTCVNPNEIIEYSVYLAVKPNKDKDGKATAVANPKAPAQLAFVRVYVGMANHCTVTQASLNTAHVDCSNKPAIIFRIAARNDKGYGPATQVRWLQEAAQPPAAGSPNTLLSPPSGAGNTSPNKRFKASGGRTSAGSGEY